MKDSLINIRPYKQEDYNFILSTWLKGFYYGNKNKFKKSKDAVMNETHAIVDAILKDTTTLIKVATLKDEEDIILGYSISGPEVLHWVFVKSDWRRFGIGKKLIPSDAKYHTFTTRAYEEFNKQTKRK